MVPVVLDVGIYEQSISISRVFKLFKIEFV